MTIKENFQAAAVRLFDTFESVLVDAEYIQQSSTYAAGGNLTLTDTSYTIRLLRDTKNLTLTLAQDFPRDAVKYLMITAELPVVPKVKDQIKIGTEVKSIVSVEADPGDIITTLHVG